MKHLIVTISVAVALCGCRPVPRSSNSASYVRDSLLVDYMTYVSQYSDCSSADWNAFYAMPIRQSTSDRNETFEEKIHSSWKRESLHSGCWLVLQNAKAELHRKSIPLRAVSSRRFCKKMDALEAAFDEAFEKMVTQEYYMRCFEDVFDETVPPKVDALAANR